MPACLPVAAPFPYLVVDVVVAPDSDLFLLLCLFRSVLAEMAFGIPLPLPGALVVPFGCLDSVHQSNLGSMPDCRHLLHCLAVAALAPYVVPLPRGCPWMGTVPCPPGCLHRYFPRYSSPGSLHSPIPIAHECVYFAFAKSFHTEPETGFMAVP